jgi:hypothetical protein
VNSRPPELVAIALKISESATLMERRWNFRPKTVTVSMETKARLRSMGYGYLAGPAQEQPDVFAVDVEQILSAAGL